MTDLLVGSGPSCNLCPLVSANPGYGVKSATIDKAFLCCLITLVHCFGYFISFFSFFFFLFLPRFAIDVCVIESLNSNVTRNLGLFFLRQNYCWFSFFADLSFQVSVSICGEVCVFSLGFYRT